MGWNAWIRQIHRWLSIAFIAGFIVNAVAWTRAVKPPTWIGIFALVPLVLLLVTGLYLFVLPYVVRWRSGGGALRSEPG